MQSNTQFISLSLITALLGFSTLQAQSADKIKSKKNSPNISLNISTAINDSLRKTHFNIGLLTNIHQLSGVGLNIVSNTVKSNVYGAQFTGLANIVGNNMNGIQLSGITNVNGNNTNGASISGLVNITGKKSEGANITGGVNIIGKDADGVTLGGLINIFGNNSNGAQISGIANITGENTNGIAVGGLMNISGKDLNGIQLSSLINVAGDNMRGMQLSLCNYSTKLHGVQIGLLNLNEGSKARGVQVGLVNHSKDSTSTIKIGLANITPNTRIQMLAFGGNTTKLNLAVRFMNRISYTMIGAGTHYMGINDKFSGSLFYRAGLYMPLIKEKLLLSGDLGYAHIENFKNESSDVPERMYSLQARLNLEYHPIKRFGIFASGGYALTRYYDQNKFYEKKPIVEVGIVLF